VPCHTGSTRSAWAHEMSLLPLPMSPLFPSPTVGSRSTVTFQVSPTCQLRLLALIPHGCYTPFNPVGKRTEDGAARNAELGAARHGGADATTPPRPRRRRGREQQLRHGLVGASSSSAAASRARTRAPPPRARRRVRAAAAPRPRGRGCEQLRRAGLRARREGGQAGGSPVGELAWGAAAPASWA
jgi:hypothetical protein